MTLTEMNSLIGRQVFLEPARGLFVTCVVTNVKTAYGHPRVEISPVSGQGTAWVSLAAIQDAAQCGAQNPEVA